MRGYTDANRGGELDEKESISGFVFLLNDDPISWSSKKQSCIALSTMEAEFVAFSSAVQEAVCLKRFLDHLGVTNDASNPVLVYCDSEAVIAYTKDMKFYCKTAHIYTICKRYSCTKRSKHEVHFYARNDSRSIDKASS